MSSSYQIIDELPQDKKRTTPWNPRGLFVLTLVSLPAGAAFFFFNWARVGLPEKRWFTLICALVAIGIPLTMSLSGLNAQLGLSRENLSFIRTALKIGFAYLTLNGQVTAYDLHINRGGPTAKAGPLWAAGIGMLVLQVLLAVLVSGRR